MTDRRSSFKNTFVIQIGLLSYLLVMLVLVLAELGVPWLADLHRTNRVLLLVGLFYLPLFLLLAGGVVRSVSLKASGQEIRIELTEVKRDVMRAESRLFAQTSNSEQALWPLLAGDDPTCNRRWNDRRIIIGSKMQSSQRFFAHLIAEWLKHAVPGLIVELAPPSGSLKAFADLKLHWIDLYVEYTGTAYQYFGIQHQDRSLETLLHDLDGFGQSLGLCWLSPLGASEGYRLVVRRKFAEAEGIVSIADLARTAGRLVFAANPDFLGRPDGYLGLQDAYGLFFRNAEPCSITDRYAMLFDQHADVVLGYDSDPELGSKAILPLEDPVHFFPDYRALPVASTAALKHVPGLEPALRALKACMTTEELTQQVQRLQRKNGNARELAERFLRDKGFIQPGRSFS